MRTLTRKLKKAFVTATVYTMALVTPMVTVPMAYAMPHLTKVTSGVAKVSTVGNAMAVKQSTTSATFDWASYNLASNQSVTYTTPGSSSVSLNIINSSTPATISGVIKSNGQLVYMAPNGLMFANGSTVNAAGVMAYGASSANGPMTGNITNNGVISASGPVSLVGANVTNNGSLSGSTVAVGAGQYVSVSNSGLSSLSVKAQGGQGFIDDNGTIKAQNAVGLDASGITTVAGTITTGQQGNVETSGSNLSVANTAVVNTNGGTWLLDPASFYIGANTSGSASSTLGNTLGHSDMSGSTLSTALANNNVIIESADGTSGSQGNIYVNQAVSWNSQYSLKLLAANSIELNAGITDSYTGNIPTTCGNSPCGIGPLYSTVGIIPNKTTDISGTSGNCDISSGG